MGRASFAEEASAPDTPSAGFVTLYFLAAGSGIPVTKDDAGSVKTVVLEEVANTFTAAQKIDVSSATALVIEDDGVNDNTLVVDTTKPGIGVGWDTIELALSVRVSGTNSGPLVPGDFLPASASTEASMAMGIANDNVAANYVGLSFQVRDSNSAGAVIYLERTADFQGDLVIQIRDAAGTAPEIMRLRHNGNVGIGATPTAQLHVDQSSATGAQPVLLLDQADISEEMIEFVSTIGVGNAIEAVGAKTLTTTHFIKVTLPGALTRYIPVGTIA